MDGIKYTIDSSFEAEIIRSKKRGSSRRPVRINRPQRGPVKFEESETPTSNIPQFSISQNQSPVLFTPISSQFPDDHLSEQLVPIHSGYEEAPDPDIENLKERYLGRLVLERFKNPSMASFFLCQLCSCVCRIGFAECTVCSSLFCRLCLEQHDSQYPNTCPKCLTSNHLCANSVGTSMNKSYISSPNLAILHSMLEVECQHYECSNICMLRELDNHERTCN